MANQQLRMLPQNAEAEKSVLGAMIIDNEAIGVVLEVLDESWFYDETHRVIYSAILQLYNNHKNIDLVTLSDHLKGKGLLENIGGVTYLTQLIDFVPSSANVEHYAHIVKEKGILRKLIKNATQIVSEGYDSKENVEHLVDMAEQLIFEVADLEQRRAAVHIKDLVKQSIETIDHLYQRKEHITGLPTGFADLDRMTSGLQKSDLIIIAGRPSMGKSALALSMVDHIGINAQKGLAMFSLEMSKEQLVQRMLCSQARVDAHKVRSGFLSPSDWPKLTAAAGKLSTASIFIDDTPALSTLELRAKARRLKSNYDIHLIVVDYLQLMRSSYKTDSRQQEISEISRSLKDLARELRVPVIALSQLSRAVENRQDHKPQLADLRESGAIEQDADLVGLLIREEYYMPTEENKGIAELIIAKQRNGPTGNVRMAFIKEFMRFENLARTENNG